MGMLDGMKAAEYNDRFFSKLGTLEGQKDLSESGSQYLKTELLEMAVNRAIIPHEPITTSDCQRNVNDNSLYVIKDIEPDAAAVGVDNLGEPDGRYVKGARYIIPIINLTTLRFQITVEDLRAYQYKITKRIEDKSLPIIHKLEDKIFFRLIGAALTVATPATQKAVKFVGTPTFDLELSDRDFIKIKNTLFSGISASDPKRLEVAAILMTQEIYETGVVLPGAGDFFGKDRVYNGVVTDTFFGTKIIKTIKSDILPIGHLWAFTSPEFLGHAFDLGDPSFEIKSDFGLIRWQTKESIGIGIGNALATALLTLKGSVAPGTATSLEVTTDGTVDTAISDYYASLTV